MQAGRMVHSTLTFLRREGVGDLIMVVAVATACIFTNLGRTRLWDRDEPRNARCAAEMRERHDWIVPTFNGELRAHKPVLLYWLMIVSYAALGVNEFAARLGSAVLAVGTVVLTYGIGVRLFNRSVGRWAAIVLSTTLMFNVAARAATPDSALIFCTTLSFFLFVLPSEPRSGQSTFSRPAAGGVYAAMGLGVLAKGLVGVVLPMAVLIAFLWSVRTERALGRHLTGKLRIWFSPRRLSSAVAASRPLLAVFVVLAVAAPWYVLVWQRTDGAWVREFFWEHHLNRATQPMEGHAGNPLFYYPVALLIGFFPWSVLAIPGCLWVARQRGEHGYSTAHRFLLAWIAVYVGAFSLASTKLPSYVTPTYPAIALMCGHFLSTWPSRCAQPAAWWPRWSSAALIVVGLAILIAIPIASHQFLPGDSWLAWIGLIPLCGGSIMLVLCFRDRIPAAMRQLAISSVAWTIGLFGLVAPRVSDHQQIEQLLAHAARGEEPVTLISYGVHEPSWVFYAGHPIRFLAADAASDVTEQLRNEATLLITSEPYHARLQSQLPPNVHVLAEVPYFLRSERLLLIGHRERRISRK